MRNFVVVLVISFANSPGLSADPTPEPVRAAITRGLRRIEEGAAKYTVKRHCFSCHHQALPLLNFAAARQRGFSIESAVIAKQLDHTLAYFRPKRDEIRKGQWMPGGSPMAGYALLALTEGGRPADEMTAALVDYLLGHQHADGYWPAVAQRPPSEGSRFTGTAFALQFLKSNPKTAPEKDEQARQQRIEVAFLKGKNWLTQAKPQDTEDKVFRVRGLVAAGSERKTIEEARDGLLSEQQSDGSWCQLASLAGDAYATGTVLTALHECGVRPDHPAYQKGVKYLLSTQKEDGSWFVITRAKPVQVFFDNGDPGGKSQFISFTATNWALLALIESLPAQTATQALSTRSTR